MKHQRPGSIGLYAGEPAQGSGFVIRSDGLPAPEEPGVSDVPPLAEETFICMADMRVFVERGEHGEVLQRFTPDQVVRRPDGSFGARVETLDRRYVADVEPIRPACRHYVRMLFPADFEDYRTISRQCMAFRDPTNSDQQLVLNDSEVLGCDYRDPPIGNGADQMDEFDQKVLEHGRRASELARHESEGFDIDAALTEDQ